MPFLEHGERVLLTPLCAPWRPCWQRRDAGVAVAGIPVNGGTNPRGILHCVNKNGNPGTLVASHPGNTNAARYGAYSARLNGGRASEIEQSLLQLAEFSATQRIAIHQIASYMAILEAIDRDLAERGLLDKRGDASSLLNHRARISRQLERLLDKVSPAIDRQTSDERQQPAGRADYIRELERIAFGGDWTASSHDRQSAINTFLKLDPVSSAVTQVTLNIIRDDGGKDTVADREPERTEAVDDAETSQVASPNSDAVD